MILSKIKAHDEARAPMTKFGIYGLVTFMIALIAVGSWLAAQNAGNVAARQAVAEVLRQAQAGCERNQVQRAYLRIRARDRLPGSPNRIKLADAYFHTVNCDATYAPGAVLPAFLSTVDDRCFLKLTKQGYWEDHLPITDPDTLRRLC